MSQFADNIKYLRKKRSLNQSEMTDFVGITGATWSDHERGKTEPSFDSLVKISDFFKVSIDVLLKKNLQEEEIKGNLIQNNSELENSNLKSNRNGNLKPENDENIDFVAYDDAEQFLYIGEAKVSKDLASDAEPLKSLFEAFKAVLIDVYGKSSNIQGEVTRLKEQMDELNPK